jgi:hypothetical protein
MGEIPPQPTGLEPLVEVFDKKLGYRVWKRPQPTHCHQGHPYAGGRVSISWVGCHCENAQQSSNGHSVYYCANRVGDEYCRDQRWQPACLDPSRQNETHRQG